MKNVTELNKPYTGVVHCSMIPKGPAVCGHKKPLVKVTRSKFDGEARKCKRCLAALDRAAALKTAKPDRVIEVKVNGAWTYTETVKHEQANKIVRALNKEGHEARSRVKTAEITEFPKFASAKPSRLREPAVPVLVNVPQIIGRQRSKITDEMFHAMLVIMDDKTPSEKKKPIHKATIKALAARDLVQLFSDGVAVLSEHGRKTTLASVAKIVSPASKIRELELA